MQDECELRIDIPLPPDAAPAAFEKGWRAALSAQKLTALAVPPARALRARFRVCGTAGDSNLAQYLTPRLHALPGAPPVNAEAPDIINDWQGVRVWLAYPAADLPLLMKRARRAPYPFSSKGRRP